MTRQETTTIMDKERKKSNKNKKGQIKIELNCGL